MATSSARLGPRTPASRQPAPAARTRPAVTGSASTSSGVRSTLMTSRLARRHSGSSPAANCRLRMSSHHGSAGS
jgi:hypothetical protein